jgi:two-component system, OmpR family, response regulator MtrA
LPKLLSKTNNEGPTTLARLLLVDDDPDQIEIRQLIMEHAGHEVQTAASAAEAIEAFERIQPDVILMDLRLPGADDGVQLLRDFRSRSASVRIVVLSGWPEDLTNRPEADLADHLFRKPVRSRELVGLINRVA